nr:hypothetical protein [Prevotella sp.]
SYYDSKLLVVTDSINALSIRSINDSIRLDAIEDKLGDFATKQALKDSTQMLRDSIANALVAANKYTDTYFEKLINDYINPLNDTVDSIRDAQNITNGEFRTAISNMQTDITNLRDSLKTLFAAHDTLENYVQTLEPMIKANSEKINSIFNAMSKQVTGIIVQGAYSPVFGLGLLPLDMKTNILSAYYGSTTANGLKFPATNDANFVNKDEFQIDDWTNVNFSDIEGRIDMGGKELLLSDADDNAGKVYLTVNPNTVDFTNKVIALETSAGKACPFELSPLKKSDYTINFGWTRADAGNGFYEANAKITSDKLDSAKIGLNTAAVKEAVKNLEQAAKDFYHRKTSSATTNLKSFATTMLSEMNKVQKNIPAYGAKATFDGLDENGNVVEKSVFSDYSIAANVVPTLSYNTLYGWNPDKVPGFDAISKFIDKLIDKIDIKIELGMGTIIVPEIKHIEIKEFEELSDDWKVKVEVTIPPVSVPINKDIEIQITVGGDVYFTQHWDAENNCPKKITQEDVDKGAKRYNGVPYKVGEEWEKDGHLTIDQSVPYEFNYTATTKEMTVTAYPEIKEQLRAVYNAFRTPLTYVNQTLDDLSSFIDDVNKLLKAVDNINKQIEDAKDKIKTNLHSYLDRAENALLRRAHYVNDAMQPLMLICSGDSYKFASKMKKYPSQIPDTKVTFVLTSFNGELLTPAYKKFLCVTKAWNSYGDQDDAEAKSANSSNKLLKVLEGSQRAVDFTGKAGYKYELMYEAVDYTGHIVARKHYIQF